MQMTLDIPDDVAKRLPGALNISKFLSLYPCRVAQRWIASPRPPLRMEMESGICRDITAERVRRVAGGYTNAKGEKVEGLGGGLQYCRLSKEPLFDATGAVREDVRFAQLAEFVWFAETGTGFGRKANSHLRPRRLTPWDR